MSGIPAAASVQTNQNLVPLRNSASSFRVLQAQAVASAQAQAQASGAPVAVEGMSTPTTQHLALPDGTMQYEASTLPVRAEQDGAWVPVDTTLVRVGDWLEPAASAAPVRFSPGGTDQLAQAQTDTGEWITERWPYGTLPTPSVEGDTATYPEVLPGVDLKMVATVTGQTTIYIVKTEKAARSARLAELHVIVEGAELTATSTGSVEAGTATGSELIAGNPLWWDSSDGGTFRAPGGDASALPVSHDVAKDRVALNVGDSVSVEEKRSADEVTYPIFVDPDWSPGLTASWYTDKNHPDVSYPSANPLRVGVSTPYHSDMFFQFPIGALSGKVVSAAVLSTTMTSVLWCSPDPIDLRTFSLTGPVNFTWSQELGITRSGVLQSQNPGNCGSPDMLVAWNALSGVTSYVSSGSVRFGITSGLARSRRHFLPGATLTVTYNTRPNTPTEPSFTMPQRTCSTDASAPAHIGMTDVSVRVKTSDPDAGNVGTDFYVAEASNLGVPLQKVVYRPAAQGWQTGTFTGLVSGKTYAWHAQASDTKLLSTNFSAWCYFTVDTVKPAVPTVTAPSGAAYVVGKPVAMSVAGAADVAGYVSWITPTQLVSPAALVPVEGTVTVAGALPACSVGVGSAVRWTCASGSSPASLVVAPTDSLSTLWVSAYDRAGNQSAAKGFPLYPNGNTGTPAAPANLDAGHAWQLSAMASPLPEEIQDSNPWIAASGISLLIPESSSRTSTDLPDPPLESPVLSTAGGTAFEVSTMVAPVNATNSFTFSVWLKGGYNGLNNATQKIAMQGGGGTGSVQFQVAPSGTLSFCVGDYGVSASSTNRASNCATGAAMNGQWQLVTGVWDAVNQQLRLYVGNSFTPVAVNGHVVGTGDRSADGPLVFGPAPMTGRWEGLFTNPVMVPGVIDHYQLARLAAFELPFSD